MQTIHSMAILKEVIHLSCHSTWVLPQLTFLFILMKSAALYFNSVKKKQFASYDARKQTIRITDRLHHQLWLGRTRPPTQTAQCQSTIQSVDG